MKLHIMSDLHTEFSPLSVPDVLSDIVILAGDVGIKSQGLRWIEATFPNKEVIYVLGNHEYYGESIPAHCTKLKSVTQGTHIHILENESITVGDITFLGATFWTDFELFGNARLASYEASQRMTDYKKIRVNPGYHKLRSIDTAFFHTHSRSWLIRECERLRGQKFVIVTHHAPSARSLPAEMQQEPIAAAYASDLDTLVSESTALVWVHGHLHNSADYSLGQTNVICNPRGYPDENQIRFNPSLIIDL